MKSEVKGTATSKMLGNTALEYAIRRVQVKQNGLKLSGTHQFMVYADEVNTKVSQKIT